MLGHISQLLEGVLYSVRITVLHGTRDGPPPLHDFGKQRTASRNWTWQRALWTVMTYV